jgi:hypothetical protein
VYQNIEVINNFFSQEHDQLLLISKISDEISIFYINVINHFAKKNNIKISFVNDLKEIINNNDLFDLTKIYFLNSSNKKILEKIIGSNNKFITLTDYKLFKEYQSTVKSINGYNYIKDIKYYLQEILKLDNKTLIENIIRNPELSYSEISKYLVSNVGYNENISLHDDTNFILEIRKDIFKLKKINDIKKIYLRIKDEAKYKKFSFLAY